MSQLIVKVLPKLPDGAICATRLVVQEHELEIRLDRRRDLIVREHAADIALVRTDPVVERRIVVLRANPG